MKHDPKPKDLPYFIELLHIISWSQFESKRDFYQNDVMQKQKNKKTIFDPRYDRLISDLVEIRQEKGFTQRSFSTKTGYSKCFIGRTETKERRLDIIETIDYMKRLGLPKNEIAAIIAKWVDEFV